MGFRHEYSQLKADIVRLIEVWLKKTCKWCIILIHCEVNRGRHKPV